jgi:glycosyltransferase involved in cell wall biosynthesis
MSCHTIAGGNLKEVIPFAAREDALPRFDRILTCLNADTTAQIDAFVPRAARAGRHRFGMWVWELPVFPAIWAGALAEVDEIWAPSRFVADAVAGATAKPVRVVPYPVAPEAAETRAARLALGLAQDAFIFLTAFDFNSFTARKNPQAAILAFRDAFPDAGDRSVRLIVKCHGTQGREVHSRLIADLIARDPRIQLIDEVYPSARMNLLQAACDAFVSLHRSEGFGLNIARCMAHGKPVVATDFGGNTDFMTTENAVPIEYRMRAVARDEYPGGAGQWWADPLHEAAVEAMRRLRERPALQAELGARARRDVRSAFSHEAVGRTMLRYWSAASSGAKGMPGAHHRLFTNAP